jgi:hypothetical protein
LIPGHIIHKDTYVVNLGEQSYQLDCKGYIYNDTIKVIDGNGNLLKEISVLNSINSSLEATVLTRTTDTCDPTHLNYVDKLVARPGSGPESPYDGDYVVSLRNLSAFALIDRGGTLKRVFTGTFKQQHSVHHFKELQFLMFDNQGLSTKDRAVSRLLLVDLSTGVEKTVFPTPNTPDEYLGMYSEAASYIDISPDKKRVWISYSDEGRAVEVDVETGRILSLYSSLHDVSTIKELSNKDETAAIFRLYGLSYADRK